MSFDHETTSEINRHQRLMDCIAKKIRAAGGYIPFADYMEAVLYTPELGYYMARPAIFGNMTGDFTTAPEISPLFGKTLGNVCHTLLENMPQAVILELGAGSGKLADDLLKTLETCNTLPHAYYIIDPSPALREQQQIRLAPWFDKLPGKIQWLDKLPEQPFDGIVIANEVLDAMPAQRFRVTPEQCFETYVKYENGTFQDTHIVCDNPELLALANTIRQSNDLYDRYDTERLPGLSDFFKTLFPSLQQGVVLLIDYGFPQHEFYHPDRAMGTLMCHYCQTANINPYQYVGLQDITTHVDFSAVAEHAHAAGFSIAGYTQQAAFLLNAGLLTHANDMIADKTAIQLLTSPSEMGELFKVMALTKNFSLTPFPGFEYFDKRHTL